MLIGFTHDLRAALAWKLIAKGHAQITQRNAPAPTIEQGAERAYQKGQPITSFARQQRNQFRGGFEPQPLQTVADLSRRAHRPSVRTLRAGCERRARTRKVKRLDLTLLFYSCRSPHSLHSYFLLSFMLGEL